MGCAGAVLLRLNANASAPVRVRAGSADAGWDGFALAKTWLTARILFLGSAACLALVLVGSGSVQPMPRQTCRIWRSWVLPVTAHVLRLAKAAMAGLPYFA